MSSTQKYPAVMPPELGQTLGDRLRKSMKAQGLTVGDMADYLELHRNTISGWLADRSRPMKVFLRLWAEKTKTPLEWVVDGNWPECTDFKRQAAPARKSASKRSGPVRASRRRTAG